MSKESKVSGGLLALLFKLGPKLMSLLAKLLKVAKFGKVSLAGASFASYAYMYTWEFALVIMGMLFIHESGHVWAMKRCGIRTKGFYFIPFLGGAAVAEDAFPSRREESFIAIMGPIWGLALCMICGLIYLFTAQPFWAAATGWMAMVNLINLLPINPLDGGRIMKSVAFSLHSWLGFLFLGLGGFLGVILALAGNMGFFSVILMIGLLELAIEFRKRFDNNMPTMYAGEIAASVAGYVLLVFVLWYLMYLTKHVPGSAAAMQALTLK